jgi:hypothetical protein
VCTFDKGLVTLSTSMTLVQRSGSTDVVSAALPGSSGRSTRSPTSEVDGRPWFCVRTGWGRRLAIDLADGKPTLARDEEITVPTWTHLASRAERAAARDILERRPLHLLGGALAVIGDERLEEMLPLLMEPAKLPEELSWTTSHAVPSWQLVRCRTRLQLCWAIRRLPTPRTGDRTPRPH